MASFVQLLSILRLLYFIVLIVSAATAGCDNLACIEFSFSPVGDIVVNTSAMWAMTNNTATYVNPYFVLLYGLYFPVFLLTGKLVI